MIVTERLVLRPYAARDRATIVAHIADAEVMRYLNPVPTDADADAMIERQNGYLATLGYCFWSVEVHATGTVIGVCGLKPGTAGGSLDGSVEIGWRFGRDSWGQGFAREAAQASLDWGFDMLPVDRIGAITVAANVRSWTLMERIGMVRDPDGDFDHPSVADDSPLKRHITYWKVRS